MYFNGNDNPAMYKVGENGVEQFGIQGSDGKPRSTAFKDSKINGNIGPDFYSVRSDPGRFSKVKTPDSRGSQSPIIDEVAATKSTSYAGCLGCPSLSAPDLQQFLMTSDSLDADIAALAHSADEQSLVTSTPAIVSASSPTNNLLNFQNISTTVMAMAPGNYNRGAGVEVSYHGVDNCDTISNNSYRGELNQGAMDLAMSNGYLSRLDSLDINIGNSLRDSLDDFYSIQVPTIETGVIESNFPSSANSPRKMNPPGQPLSVRSDNSTTRITRPDIGVNGVRNENDCVARNSMYMDFFQPQPLAPLESIIQQQLQQQLQQQQQQQQKHTTDQNIVRASSDVMIASQLSSASLPSSSDHSTLDPISSSESIRDILEVVDPFTGPLNQFHRGKGSKTSDVNTNHTKKKKNSTSTSTSSSSSSDSKESTQQTNVTTIGVNMNINMTMTHINSIFNYEHHTGLESLSCMSIDDGSSYPLGTISEAGPALRVSSSDWNDHWERTGSSSSGISSAGGLLGLGCLTDGHPVVVNALDDFGDHDEFMQFNFHSASLDILNGGFHEAVSHFPPIPTNSDTSAIPENDEMTFEQLQLFQRQQLKGGVGGMLPLGAGTLPPRDGIAIPTGLGSGRPIMPFSGGARTMKPGFKYANKQPVIKKDPGLLIPTDKTIPAMSPSSDTKRVRLEKKKGGAGVPAGGAGGGASANTLQASFVSFAANTLCLPVTVGAHNNSNNSQVLTTSSSGGISDTVFHGFRRRSKLSEAELEDQRALEQVGDGALLVARGRYKCGRCGQLKTNHVCEYYEDTSVCSTATQISLQVIDPSTSKPWEGERFLIVGTKRNVAHVQDDALEVASRTTGASDASIKDANGKIVKTSDLMMSSNSAINNMENNNDTVTGGILLNSGKRVGMGLKLSGLVHFAEEVDADDEWRMSVQNSAFNSARKGINDQPYENIFQLRQALNPTFPVDFDSATTTPGPSTPYIPSPYTHHVPIDTAAVVIVLNSLEEKCEEEESEGEGKDGEEDDNGDTIGEELLLPSSSISSSTTGQSLNLNDISSSITIPTSIPTSTSTTASTSTPVVSSFIVDSSPLPVCLEGSSINQNQLISSSRGGGRSRRTS